MPDPDAETDASSNSGLPLPSWSPERQPKVKNSDTCIIHNMPGVPAMIDHLYLPVTDLDRSIGFYSRILGDLGWKVMGSYTSTIEGVPDLYVFYAPNNSSIWLRLVDHVPAPYYVGISISDRSGVDSVYATALTVGALDAGRPALRRYFSEGYYAANILDPDGHTLELVNKG